MSSSSHLLLSKSEEISELSQKLNEEEIIAFDVEFIRESTFYPQIEVIQVATEREAWLVDARVEKEKLAPLLDLFKNEKILKIVHAAHGDQECLHTAFQILAKPILDTSIAAALCGYGEGVGLGSLLKSVLNVEIKKGHARSNWSVRPLPEHLTEYALADVQNLVAMGKKLIEELQTLGRKDWAFQLSSKFQEPELYDTSPEQIAQKLAGNGRFDRVSYSALVELLIWREERVRHLNLPRRWLADDSVLMDLALVRPKDMGHLGSFRGINRGEIKKSGEVILKAIAQGVKREDLTPPKKKRVDIPSDTEQQALELLKCYVKILADNHRVAVKYLLQSSYYLKLLRCRAVKVEDYVSSGILEKVVADLIGKELLDFLSGKKALAIRNQKIHGVDLALPS